MPILALDGQVDGQPQAGTHVADVDRTRRSDVAERAAGHEAIGRLREGLLR
jgi:hypothetical protein